MKFEMTISIWIWLTFFHSSFILFYSIFLSIKTFSFRFSRPQIVRPINAFLVVDVQNDFISGSLNISNCSAQQNGLEVSGTSESVDCWVIDSKLKRTLKKISSYNQHSSIDFTSCHKLTGCNHSDRIQFLFFCWSVWLNDVDCFYSNRKSLFDSICLLIHFTSILRSNLQ